MHTEHLDRRGASTPGELVRAIVLLLAPGTVIVGLLALVRGNGMLMLAGVGAAAAALGLGVWAHRRHLGLKAVAPAPGACLPSPRPVAPRSSAAATAT